MIYSEPSHCSTFKSSNTVPALAEHIKNSKKTIRLSKIRSLAAICHNVGIWIISDKLILIYDISGRDIN
jgi:hypothetical protein